MADVEALLRTDRPFLTDGGFETWLFFQKGFEAPEFAAIVLMDDEAARTAMRSYFDEFLSMAERAGTGFVLDTNTWRGGGHWGPALGKSESDMLRLTGDAVSFAKGLREAWQSRVAPILLNGVIGPAGDGYAADTQLSPEAARDMHRPQIECLARAGVDMISAVTMPHTSEAIGITRCGAEFGLPAVISFTVETDGHLPSGESLGEAIAKVDTATGNGPLYYMVNCAHPDHFAEAVSTGASWVGRIGGVRANASRRSHAEIDEAETLDDGDPEEFGLLHVELAKRLPGLRVVGGCCGTDHRHVACVSKHLHEKAAA
ncbi:homocysteine S-methyltransferase family protein [Methyloceanibacter sp. wino2]|uniref:homocysteine S-methyltransferase family protein n=1 Tax=Methyloceanibacter sp. wino2 TaxID=2170729 RepID=UPI000D3E7C96|nr:homocysteine S-methyltransferase family protein [Methyloceanibacter sp. wino2]